MFRQAPSDGPCGLGAEIEWGVFLVLVEDAQLRALVGVNDCEDASDGFTEVVSMPPQHNTKSDHATHDRMDRERAWRACESGMYILFSLEAFPPEIFCTRN